MSAYEIVDRVATAEEHREISASVGWEDHIDDRVLEASLRGAIHGVVAVHDGVAVAMARLVGDGAHYFYVQDVIVHPDHAEQGLGSTLTERLLDWVAAHANATVFVGLFASPDAEGIYEGLGFSTADMTGMHREMRPHTS